MKKPHSRRDAMRRTGSTVLISTILALAFFLIASAAIAQQGNTVDNRVAELDKLLKLSDQQKQEIKKLIEEDEARMAERGGGRPGGRGGMFMMRSRLDSAIEEVLTEAQAEKFRENRRAAAIEMRIENLDRELKLKDDQKTKLRAIFENETKKTEELFESTEDRREAFSQMRDIREKTDEELGKVLDRNQKKRYEEMQEEMRSRMRDRRGN